MGAAAEDEVLRVLAARKHARVALAIEGGGMRGTVSAGMAFALYELGLVTDFDAVYGSSAGAISGAWLLSSRPEGLRGWTDPAFARALIKRSAMLRGRPVADVRALVEEVYQTVFPLDFESVLSSPVEFHPLATDTATGESTDLRPLIDTPAELRLALRASAAMPLLAGPPVILRGQRFYDAGVSESIPYRTALAQGATHVLVLRSRRDPLLNPEISRSDRLFARTALRRESAGLRAAFLGRELRLAADDRRLDAAEEDEGTGPPWVFSVRPAADTPFVGRLESDGQLLHTAFEAGRSAVHEAFGSRPPADPAAP
jgi:predicted patatin/cPLA2 family phospholipase